ncbi:MAG: winged helix DNA-binding domain-containing protein [Tannerella sp.]|jgi:hypothetical protein|nr:winged helix DNA-binding domain-containing protein [Tannerella sp.]
MNIPAIRIISNRLASTQLQTPHEVVAWMGAVQAQNCGMSKWAVGVRLKNSTLTDIDAALAEGEILRTHVMRPTWHLVAAEDIRWMCELSKKSIKAATAHRDRQLEIDEKLYTKVNHLLETMLRDNNHLTRIEISSQLRAKGVATDTSRMIHFMVRAEVEGIVCSGIDRGKSQTYALIEERAKPAKKRNRDEALALLAHNYFQSHSPATLSDFAWWSGLSSADSRQALRSIENELTGEPVENQTYFIHQSLNTRLKLPESVHLLPAFDEYIIAYKDRTAVIAAEYQPRAFTKNGLFFPVVLHHGKAVGVWNKSIKNNDVKFDYDWFEKDGSITNALLEEAENRYRILLHHGRHADDADGHDGRRSGP